MDGRFRRLLMVAMVLALVAAACGDDDGEATTTAASSTSGAGPTTTAPWGEAVAAGAEAMMEGARALLREDFQDGDTVGWQVDAGWFILENGDRRMAGAGGEAWAWYQDGLDWSRYGARLAFVVNGGSLGVSVAVGPEGRYLVHVSDAGVYLLKDSPFGSVSALGSAQPVSLGAPHVLAVGLDGGHLQVYVDGRLLIDAVDAAPLAGGSIGLGAGDGSAVAVDNIVVAALGGPLPDIQSVGEPADEPLPDDLGDGAPEAGEGLEGGPGDGGGPNLAITGVSYPMQIRYGEAFDVSLTMRNVGEVAVGGSLGAAFLSHGDQCEAGTEGLAAGAEVTLTCRFPGYSANGEGTYEWTAAADSGGDVDEGPFEDDNLAAGTITIARGEPEESLANLAVGYVEWDPMFPSPDDVITISVGVSQTNVEWAGTLAAIGFRVFHEGGNTACSGTAEVRGAVFYGTCQILPFGDSGEYWLNVVIDERGELAESDEEDNSLFVSIRVSAISLFELPNLWFEEIVFQPSAPQAGQPIEAHIVLGSNSSDPLPSYTVRLLIDGVVVGSRDTTMQTGSQVFSFTAPAAGDHVWSVELDADNDFAESSEIDNNRSGVLRVQG